MIEIDVTHMVDDADGMRLLFGSIAELGDNAGRITWQNSCEYAAEHPLLTPEQFDDARDYFRDCGVWEDDEIDAWMPEEIQGMVTQEVAARIREMEHFDSYEEYMEAAQAGRCSGAVYRGDDGRFYFLMSH